MRIIIVTAKGFPYLNQTDFFVCVCVCVNAHACTCMCVLESPCLSVLNYSFNCVADIHIVQRTSARFEKTTKKLQRQIQTEIPLLCAMCLFRFYQLLYNFVHSNNYELLHMVLLIETHTFCLQLLKKVYKNDNRTVFSFFFCVVIVNYRS